ncbi:MAG: outer membrane lipoprotein carrier protein LolA [Elusimicrobiota bacterium]
MNKLIILFFLIVPFWLNAQNEVSTNTFENKGIEVVKMLIETDNKLKSLKSDFEQEVLFKVAEIKQKVKGNITYLKPDNIKIIHSQPQEQTIIINSKKDITIVKPKDKQIIKTSYKNWKSGLEPKLKGLLEFGNYSSLLEEADVKSEKIESGYLLKITPKNKGYKLKLKLNSNFFPVEGELDLGDTIVTTILKNIEINPEVKKEEFEYKNENNYDTIKL